MSIGIVDNRLIDRRLIASELEEGEYVTPPILTGKLIKDSRRPLVRAIREHKHYLSKKAERDVGWIAAKRDFIENGFRDYWEYGFKYGYRSRPSLKVDPSLRIKTCQDFEHYMKSQKEAAELSMLEIRRRAYSLDAEVERELFNEYQATYWVGGFREGFCGYACPCHGCENSLKLILKSEPNVVKRIFQNQLERSASVK